MNIKHVLGGWTMAIAVLLGVLLPAPSSFAIDRVVLKDGQTIEGEIIREVEGYIWVKYTIGGIEQEKMIAPGDIAKLERDAAAAPVTAAPVVADETTKTPVSRPGVPRAAVITMEEMVGMYMTAYALEEAIPMLEEQLGTDKSGIVVLRIRSGGGALLEIQKLSDMIHNEYKSRWRTVAWIDSAISAAAMTAHCCEEIYFTPQGNYGACTGYRGALDAMKGRELVEVLHMMEKISSRGGYDSKIMRSMQIDDPLSCTIDADGQVMWYQSTAGEILVNRPGDILTFNAQTALKVKFSRGTAATKEELAKLMGYQEVDWVGVHEKGVLWPVSKAEKWTQKYRKKAQEDEERMNEYYTSYRMQVEAAASAPRENRGAFVGRARQSLEKMRSMVRNNPAFILFIFNMDSKEEFDEWYEKQDQMLRDLLR